MIEQSVYRARDSVAAQAIADEMVLLDLESGIYYSLNAVGSFLWTRLGASATPAALAEEVIANFEVDRAEADDDTRIFLDRLSELNLVVTE